MASDEQAIEYSKTREVLIEIPYTTSNVRNAITIEIIAAYTQGRADAWRWRKYPEEKPDVSGGEVLVRREERREFWQDDFVSKTEKRSTKVIDVYKHCEVEHYDEESWGKYSDDVVTHWLPITLPGGEND